MAGTFAAKVPATFYEDMLKMKRIVLAYSGGLDTSVAIPWLAEKHGAEIIAVTLDRLRHRPQV